MVTKNMNLIGVIPSARRWFPCVWVSKSGLAVAIALGCLACVPDPVPVPSTDGPTADTPQGAGTGNGGSGSGQQQPDGAAADVGSSADTSDASLTPDAPDASPVPDAAGGAGGPDASPPPDAGDAPGDPPPDTGSVVCTGLLCEDFEKGQIDPAIWSVQTGGGGTLTVQQQVVAHGKFAMQVHGQAGPTTDFALIATKNAPAALRGTAVYVRVYFLITPNPLTSTHTEMDFAGTNGTGPNNGAAAVPKLRYMEVANLYGSWQLAFDLLDQFPPVEIVAYPNKTVPTMTWTCMEWHFEDQPDRITLWTDGNQIGTFDNEHIGFATPVPLPAAGDPIYDGMSSGIIGGFDQFGLGFHDWGPKQPFDLYYDDLVLDTQRVGCLPNTTPSGGGSDSNHDRHALRRRLVCGC